MTHFVKNTITATFFFTLINASVQATVFTRDIELDLTLSPLPSRGVTFGSTDPTALFDFSSPVSAFSAGDTLITNFTFANNQSVSVSDDGQNLGSGTSTFIDGYNVSYNAGFTGNYNFTTQFEFTGVAGSLTNSVFIDDRTNVSGFSVLARRLTADESSLPVGDFSFSGVTATVTMTSGNATEVTGASLFAFNSNFDIAGSSGGSGTPLTEIEPINQIVSNGTYTNPTGTTLNVPFIPSGDFDQFLIVESPGTLVNDGTLNNDFNVINIGTINNDGVINNTGFFSNTPGATLTNNNEFNNINGVVNIAATSTIDGSGTLTQTDGALTVNGTVDNTVVINGGTLSGAGTINGDVFLGDESEFTPGNSPGTLTINGDFTVEAGALLQLEFGDLIDVTGDVNIEAGAVIEIVFGDIDPPADINLADFFDVTNPTDPTLEPVIAFAATDITIFADSGDGTGDRQVNAFGTTTTAAVQNTSQASNSDALNSVPEPGALALYGFGLAGLGLLRHRRRRAA